MWDEKRLLLDSKATRQGKQFRYEFKLAEFVNHSPAARDLQILLVFYQYPAWFISLLYNLNHRKLWSIA